MRKETRELLAELERQGWRYRLNKHIVLYSPDKSIPPITIACTSGGGRGFENALAFLRKNGAKV